MVTYSHAIYIDESGNGSPTNDIHRYWVSVAIAVAFDQTQVLNEGIRGILADHFYPLVRELKGSSMPKYMRPTSSVTDVARDLGKLLDISGARAWAAASSHGAKPPPGFSFPKAKPKDIARQLLLERINAVLLSGYNKPDHCLIIWDISDQQELQDFSASIAEFRSPYDGAPRSDRLAPAALGGLSHDWSGLQTADVIANCALHHLGHSSSLAGAKTEKAQAFGSEFLPRMQRIGEGKLLSGLARQQHKKR